MRRPISWVRPETMYAIDPSTPMARIRSPVPVVNPPGTPHKPSAKMDRQRDGSLATGAILAVLITMLGPISGAHFNPAVTVAFLIRREMDVRMAFAYIVVQVAAGLAGVALAHAMFDVDLVQVSTKVRTGFGQWLAEAVATFGLVATILATLKARPRAVAAMVGLYISAGYWFTASTSFANPAVTVGRSFTDSFSGIAPADAPAFIAAQFVGALLATGLMAWLLRDK